MITVRVRTKDMAASIRDAAHHDLRPALHITRRAVLVFSKGRPAITEVVAWQPAPHPLPDDQDDPAGTVCAQCMLYALGRYADCEAVGIGVKDGRVYILANGEVYRVPNGDAGDKHGGHCGWIEPAD